jgi:hypothetical protein
MKSWCRTLLLYWCLILLYCLDANLGVLLVALHVVILMSLLVVIPAVLPWCKFRCFYLLPYMLLVQLPYMMSFWCLNLLLYLMLIPAVLPWCKFRCFTCCLFSCRTRCRSDVLTCCCTWCWFLLYCLDAISDVLTCCLTCCLIQLPYKMSFWCFDLLLYSMFNQDVNCCWTLMPYLMLSMLSIHC